MTWSSDSLDHPSLSIYCVFLGDSLIAWMTKKQLSVSHSRVVCYLSCGGRGYLAKVVAC
jgi:hypothetical protein